MKQKLIVLLKKNAISLILLGYIVYQYMPTYLNALKLKNTEIPIAYYKTIGTEEDKILTPPSKYLLLFWASWCMPCHLEMKRLKNSVESGKISSNQIIAVNPFETLSEIEKYLEKSPQPFTFVTDRRLVKLLNINSTPTMVMINGNRVEKIKSGINLWGIWEIENFLQGKI